MSPRADRTAPRRRAGAAARATRSSGAKKTAAKRATPRVVVALSYGAPRRGVPSKASFQRWAELALAGRRGPAEVSIRVVGAREGRLLNRKYRERDYATNVLSFPAGLPDGVPLLGDLAICASVVAAEAKAQGKPLRDHWTHLTIHGVLHLVGYDHKTSPEADVMEAKERQVLESLGIPDPYLAE